MTPRVEIILKTIRHFQEPPLMIPAPSFDQFRLDKNLHSTIHRYLPDDLKDFPLESPEDIGFFFSEVVSGVYKTVSNAFYIDYFIVHLTKARGKQNNRNNTSNKKDVNDFWAYFES